MRTAAIMASSCSPPSFQKVLHEVRKSTTASRSPLARSSRASVKSGPKESRVGEPGVLPAHVALARIYFRLGKKEEGRREKEKIAELESKQQKSLVPNAAPLPTTDGHLP